LTEETLIRRITKKLHDFAQRSLEIKQGQLFEPAFNSQQNELCPSAQRANTLTSNQAKEERQLRSEIKLRNCLLQCSGRFEFKSAQVTLSG